MTPATLGPRALLFLALAVPAPGTAQGVEGGSEPDSLPQRPWAEATALLEKTFLRIDVARLRIRFGASAVEAMEDLPARRGGDDERSTPFLRGEVADSLERIAVRSTDAWASLTFLWGIGFERFIEEMRSGARTAAEAGLIDQAFLLTLSAGFPIWYAPLRDRGIRAGDVMTYRIRGDTLRTTFRTGDGRVLVEQVDVGEAPRLSVLGGFFASGSEFRAGLLESLMEALEAGSRSGLAPPWDRP